MANPQTVSDMKVALMALGLSKGDTVLARAATKSIGPLENGPRTLIEAILDVIGPEGTLVSLAFTGGSFLFKPRPEDAFDIHKPSSAGAFPNVMLQFSGARRSRHPMCSYVAIGKHAEALTENHNENSGAYEPVRSIMHMGGKCMLIGCVNSSPGFTTTHVAENDLGLFSRIIFPQLSATYYKSESGELRIYRRKDLGFCSQSFYKFYSHYVREGILSTGYVGDAYSILSDANDAYNIDLSVLKTNPRFNVCDSPDCFPCNARRWDRIYKLPSYAFRKSIKQFKRWKNK